MPEIIAADDTQKSTEQKELSAELARKIEELGEPDSTIIVQEFYYERSSAEIGKELGMKPSDVRMRSARAMKKLKKALEKDGYTL
jgi:RNA polymerase sigma-70 factor (ECF subfamily)